MTYPEWCQINGCSHGHCPLDCEHPQPFAIGDYLYCGRCWFVDGVLTEFEPCGPENCEGKS